MMNTSKIKFLALSFALVVGATAEAKVFTVESGSKPAALTASQWDLLLTSLEDEVNSKFTDNATVSSVIANFESGKYNKGSANATAMASSGTTAVYGSSFKYGLVGFSGSVGADLGEGNSITNFDAKKVAGASIQSAAVIGFSPGSITSSQWGFIDPSRLRLFVSFLTYDQKLDDADVSFTTFGAVGHYRIIAEKSIGMGVAKWNGVDVSSGIRYAKNKLSFTTVIADIPDQTQGPITASIADSPATIGADVGVFSVPVEVSTSVRLLYFLNLFGGVGGDFNFGSSKSVAVYDAPITFSGGSGSATGSLDLGANASPTPWNLRGFAGAGIEFAIGTLNLSVGKSFTAGTLNANVGFNLFF